MVTDKILTFGSWVLGLFTEFLPDSGHLSLPVVGPLGEFLGKLDTLIPILGPLQLAMTVLSAVVAFVALRVLLTLWNLVWP